MRLYIAEKPSMGAEIAKCLTGPVQRKDGYLITKDGIVTWAFGHILRQAEPEEYNAKYKNWKAEDLPIIPKQWKMIIDESCKKQFGIIKNLIDKADEIVHAGDPDREGQLLIDEVLDYLNCQKPVKRILLNALDEAKTVKGKPTIIIAKTVKGKGVSFMENVCGFHGVAPTKEETEKALAELGGNN